MALSQGCCEDYVSTTFVYDYMDTRILRLYPDLVCRRLLNMRSEMGYMTYGKQLWLKGHRSAQNHLYLAFTRTNIYG